MCSLDLMCDTILNNVYRKNPSCATDFCVTWEMKKMSTKDNVLNILEQQNGGSISGARIADKLGITRASVWKAVKALQNEGYKISAVTNRGYMLKESADRLSEARIKKFLHTDFFGKTMYVFDSIDSTNVRAKSLAASGAPHGTLVAADMQTAGRGRLGRSFFSPQGAGVYFTLVLRPDFGADSALLITSAAAVAVCRAVDKIASVSTQIKWVNDIYLDGKKLCGILTEAVSNFESGEVEFLAVGIGINVTNDAFPDELSDTATSVSVHTQVKPDRCELIAQVLNEFEKIYKTLEKREYMEEYRERSCVLGKRVYALRAGTKREVFVKGIDDDGALIVKNEKGEAERINSGEISIRLV